MAAATAAIEGKVSKTLKKTLKKLVDEDVQNQLLVADAKLGSAIKDKLSLQCVSNSGVQELMRCIRSQSESLLAGLPKKEMTAMALGLAHSLSRYKLKFSPDKIDTMIVQAQCLLDDLDKEINNYNMRIREWWVNLKALVHHNKILNYYLGLVKISNDDHQQVLLECIDLIIYFLAWSDEDIVSKCIRLYHVLNSFFNLI